SGLYCTGERPERRRGRAALRIFARPTGTVVSGAALYGSLPDDPRRPDDLSQCAGLAGGSLSAVVHTNRRARQSVLIERNPGDKFGPYEVVSPIGKGGMGEVWKATDTRLHRDVAIKFCGRQFSDRFLREARAIAALNHPNICTLYDIGPDYLVMEYIADAPSRGPLEASEAI